jgi:uncharacterized protein (TIGR00369 family)
MVEPLASTGAAIHARLDGRHTVGLENSTSFLEAVREGTLTGRATLLTRGRQNHVWAVEIHDDQDRLVAQGRVRAGTPFDHFAPGDAAGTLRACPES